MYLGELKIIAFHILCYTEEKSTGTEIIVGVYRDYLDK
jgi:hypothetical protein